MTLECLSAFRLVGGTALSLHLGHRVSEDIDLFASEPYGSIPFHLIEQVLTGTFPYIENFDFGIPELNAQENHFGLHLNIGDSRESSIKTDILNWNDNFIDPQIEIDAIRIASVRDIALMKLDVISRGGRKKDFWDLSEILDYFSLSALLTDYEVKYPFYEVKEVINGLVDFSKADSFPDPICLKGRHWELIQKEMIGEVTKLT